MSRAVTEQAALWFLRLKDAHGDAALQARFAAWQQSNPQHAAEFEAIRALWDGFDSVDDSRRLAQDAARFRADHRRRLLAGSMAGLLALLVLPFAWRHWQERPLQTLSFETAKGQTRQQMLPDGSRVVLGADSAVEVVYTRRDRRVRLLRGEALFDVVREADTTSARGFHIATDDAVASVLGTRFIVADQVDLSAITVLEGRVRVASSDAPGALELGAGEAADVASGRAPQRVEREPSQADDFIEGRIVFRSASLEEVAETLSRYRARPVRASSIDHAVRIDAVIQPGAVEEFLRMLPEISPVQVSQRGDETHLTPR